MTRRELHRRRLLRGAGGIAIGLPFLESFASRRAMAAPPRRFAVFFQCNGVNMERWWPREYGALTPEKLAGTALEPLAPLASKLLVPRGIAMAPRGYALDGVPGCDHQKGMGVKLTCTALRSSGGYPTGPSIDLAIAKRLNPNGQSPLNLGVGTGGSGPTSSAFYTASGQPAPMQRRPWDAFKDWMGAGAPAGAMTVDLVAVRRKSVLDAVRADLTSLQASGFVGVADRRKLDLHASAIRQLETSMTTGGGAAVSGCSLPADRTREIQANDGAYQRIASMMMDIMGIAMACDHNRVTTCQLGTGAGGPIYKWCGDKLNQQYNHHKLSHGATTDAATSPNLPDAEWKLALFNIDTWHMQQLRVLLDRLNSYAEPGGTVLDNSVVLYMNELSHGIQHNFADLPVLVAGSGGGSLKQGQLVKMTSGSTGSTTECPTNLLFATLANAVGYRDANGAPMTTFGVPKNAKMGELAQLKA